MLPSQLIKTSFPLFKILFFSETINFKPNFLFHLGAHTDLEYCEKNLNDAFNTNTISVENAVHISNNLNVI